MGGGSVFDWLNPMWDNKCEWPNVHQAVEKCNTI